MSPKVSATYRIKLQIYLSLNLAFEKAGPNHPGSTTKNPGLHRRQSPRSWERGARGLSKSPDRRGPIRWGWCWRPVPISSISLRAEFRRGAILRRPPQWFERRSACRPDAWAQALEVLGEHDTSIVIAAILQRGEEIKSAGGYLRVLTAKARAGEFSLGPVLMALLRGKAAKAARERKRAG